MEFLRDEHGKLDRRRRHLRGVGVCEARRQREGNPQRQHQAHARRHAGLIDRRQEHEHRARAHEHEEVDENEAGQIVEMKGEHGRLSQRA